MFVDGGADYSWITSSCISSPSSSLDIHSEYNESHLTIVALRTLEQTERPRVTYCASSMPLRDTLRSLNGFQVLVVDGDDDGGDDE